MSLANITGVPGKVDRAVLTLARGSKTQTSSASDVADGAAMWRSAELDPDATLAFVATLFKNADGSFEKKEYSVKAQACLHTPGAKTAKLATFAKTVVDLAQYATLEPPPEGTFTYLPLDAGASKAKGVIAGINVNVRWLKDAKRGDADAATEDSGMSGRLGGSAVGSGASDVDSTWLSEDPAEQSFDFAKGGRAASAKKSAILDQDLRGFEEETGGAATPQQQHAFAHEPRVFAHGRDPRAPALTPVREGTPGGEKSSPESSALEREAHSAVANSPQHTPAHVVVARAIAPYQAEIEDVRAQLAEAKTALAVAESDAKEFEVKLASARDALRAVVAENERKMSDAAKAHAAIRNDLTAQVEDAKRQAAEVANAATEALAESDARNAAVERASAATLAEMRERAEKAEKQLGAAMSASVDADTAAGEIEKMRQAAVEEAAGLRAKLSDAEERAKAAEAKRAAAAAEAEKATEAKIAALEKTVADAEAAHEAKVAAVEKERARTATELTERIQALEDELSRANGEAQRAKTSLGARVAAADAKASVSLDALRAQMARDQKDAAQREETLRSKLESAKVAATKVAEDLREELEKARRNEAAARAAAKAALKKNPSQKNQGALKALSDAEVAEADARSLRKQLAAAMQSEAEIKEMFKKTTKELQSAKAELKEKRAAHGNDAATENNQTEWRSCAISSWWTTAA